ncbi:receptor-like protein EIX2 isoform X2 [Musa acuminata AAA Group]|uniref:receptor-like protein EIX2 isoform X2 n=1 Tax=Musa acuminata AAA Group TaxID=214697 RepID=UPI0031DE7DBE
MATDNVYVLFFLLAFVCIQLIKPNVCDGALTSGCIPAERSALLEFKRGLEDPTNRLSSWVNEDCCKWEGVTCSNHTGHVVKLDLHNPPNNIRPLGGELPNCWSNSIQIRVMDFSSNNISGVIPESICSIESLQSLHLSNNSLSGELPLSLKDCGNLYLLDAENNNLKGEIPTWIGENITHLRFLNLRSNMLFGDIPPNLSRLSSLQFLDLADNELSGTIPRSFGNFTGMKVIENFSNWTTDQIRYQEQMFITTKGNTRSYGMSLLIMNILDLSDNNLSGGVPEELTGLFGLFSLNLSGNHFTGEITENISKLQQLESLDLSRNNFSGTIPSSLAALTYLAHLNLSYNNLSGEIPRGNQLLTFNDPSIYIGNPGLCGLPLNQSCNVSETTRGQSNANDRDKNEMIWFYTSMAPGFVVGFWAVWGTLILNKNWNLYYFRFIDNMLDKVYVFTVLKVSRIRKRCCSQQG